MYYAPVKQQIGSLFQHHPFLRKILFFCLRLLLLRVWYIRRAIKQWAKHRRHLPQHILDAGSGFGQHAYYLAGMSPNWSVLAIDIDTRNTCQNNRLFACKHRSNLLFKTADLTHFCQPDSFDLILAIDVLEYIYDDQKVLNNFYTSLRKEGMLLVYVPSLEAAKEGKDGKAFCEEQVRVGYSKEELCSRLQLAGFRHIKVRYAYARPGQWSWRLSIKLPMQLLKYSRHFALLLPVYYLCVYPICFVLNYLDILRVHNRGEAVIALAFR